MTDKNIPNGFFSVESFNFPNIVNVNVYTGQCCCRCIHCPIGSTKIEDRTKIFRQGYIHLDIYKKIIDEIAEKSKSSVIRIHSVGEPLFWQELPNALKYSKEKNVKTWIFTCAVTNDKQLLSELCENANIIEISVNSVDEQDYLNTKGIDAFKIVFDNIKYISDYKKNNNLETRIIVSRVQSNDEIKDNEFVNFWKQKHYLDDVFVRSYHTYNNLITPVNEDKSNKKAPCLVHWARFNIDFTGDVIICFNELFKTTINPNFILGNIKDNSIAEIWQSNELNVIRQAELSGDYSCLSYEKDLPCKNCNFCQPLFGNKQTSEYQIKNIK